MVFDVYESMSIAEGKGPRTSETEKLWVSTSLSVWSWSFRKSLAALLA